jgi:hypothetical protein
MRDKTYYPALKDGKIYSPFSVSLWELFGVKISPLFVALGLCAGEFKS